MDHNACVMADRNVCVTVHSANSTGSMDLALEEPLIMCRLCLTEYPADKMYTLKECKCVYCEMCVIQYLEVLISEGDVLNITCPDAACKQNGKIPPDEVNKLVSTSMHNRYQRLKLEQEVALDPGRTFCPKVTCSQVCHVCRSSDQETMNKPAFVHCSNCGLDFCSFCKSKWHGNGKCTDTNSSISKNADAPIKRCPMCSIMIERMDGCAQMMCRRCKHVFCWYCLQSLEDDFLLRHYDKGPCKNKLGHSRASVIWHRTQVIGIFAGFALLVVVASPFLLLASPCLIWCKLCKVCELKTDDEDENNAE